MDMLDLYSDYLIFQNKYATATGLSDLVDGAFAHDKVTRFLRLEDFGSKSLWRYIKNQLGRKKQLVEYWYLMIPSKKNPTLMRMKLIASITLMPKGVCSKG